MLDLKKFTDDVYIYTSTVDGWGVHTEASEGTLIKGTIREQIESLTMEGQKGKNVLVKYTITLPHSVVIKPTDIIGIPLGDKVDKYEILKLVRSKDLSGETLFYKVWI